MRYDDELRKKKSVNYMAATWRKLNRWFKGTSQLEDILEFRLEGVSHAAMDNGCNIVVDELQTAHVVTG